MAIPGSGWWMSLVAALPTPGSGERVNVAIVTGNGRPQDLIHTVDLPRLVGLATVADRRGYDGLLQGMKRQIERGTTLAELRAAVSPQLELTEPRELLAAPDDRVRKALENRYLRQPAAEKFAELRLAMKVAATGLDQMIQGMLQAVGTKYQRDASLSSLYPQVFKAQSGLKSSSVARVVRVGRRDVLLDSVDLRAGHASDAVRVATARIGRTFWHVQNARDDLRRLESVEIRTVGVLIVRKEDRALPDVRDAADYISHVWRHDADLVVDERKPDSRARLSLELAWATGSESRT